MSTPCSPPTIPLPAEGVHIGGDVRFGPPGPDGGPSPDNSDFHDYLGVRRRFADEEASRRRADGPTLGDLGGTSVLDDGGHHARSFRAAKRL